MRQNERNDIGPGDRFALPPFDWALDRARDRTDEWSWEVDMISALLLLVWFTGMAQLLHHVA